MNFRVITKLYFKELKEILRTFGLIVSLIIFPAIIYPAMLYYTGQTTLAEKNKVDSATISVFVKGSELIPNLSDYIYPDDNIVFLKNGNYDKIDKDCKLIISLEKSTDLFKSGYSNIVANLEYDSTDKYSLKALDRFERILFDVNKESTYERFDEKNIPPEIMNFVSVNSKNIAPPKKITGELIGNIIPLFLIMFITSGAMQVAIDITAGEKDRKTIQTLLISPAKRIDIIISKLFVVITTALVSGFVNLCSMYLAIYLMPMSKFMIKGMKLDFQTFILGLLVIIPLVLLFSSVLTAIGVASKNQVEAGFYTMPIFFLDFIPFIALSTVEIASLTNLDFFIPVYNTALAIKLLLMSSFTWQQIFITIFSNLIYSVFFVFLCVKLFSNEDIVFSGVGDSLFVYIKKIFMKN